VVDTDTLEEKHVKGDRSSDIYKREKKKKYYVKSNINGPNSRKLVHRLLTRTLRVGYLMVQDNLALALLNNS
jgi:hypothetical protein